MTMSWAPIPGETPIDPSGLKAKWITNRRDLNEAEAQNIRKPLVKYAAAKPTARTAPFDFDWCLKLHQEMFGKVWTWAGRIRDFDGQNVGIPHHRIREELACLLNDLQSWS